MGRIGRPVSVRLDQMRIARPLVRPLLAGIFVLGGVDTFRKPEPRARLAAPVIEQMAAHVPALPQDPVEMVRANAALQVVAGGMLALGLLPRLAALLLAGSLVPTTLGGHRFWEIDDQAQRLQQRSHFLKNTAILGGLLLAALD
jgi:putative oxidoreductase